METFNPAVLTSILAARHLTLKGVSERMGVAEDKLRETINDNPRPNQKIIAELSAQLSVPAFVFFMDRPPEISKAVVDFREVQPTETPKLPATVRSISLAQRLQEVAIHLGHSDSLPRNIALSRIRSSEFPTDLRVQLGISVESQVQARDAGQFYSLCRAAVEQTGIFVMHESFPSEDGSGFCLADGDARFIVINTHKQNPGRRNFTLFHELAHALMGRSGISDPFVVNNTVERTCNVFAARLLVPDSLATAAANRFQVSTEPTVDDIRRCAKFLNISQQATIVRLEQLGLVDAGSHDRWLETVRANGNPDFEKRGGGQNVAQERVKLAKFGYTFARVFGRAIERSAISPLDLYRMSGLKPKYQRPYFQFASTAGSIDADEE